MANAVYWVGTDGNVWVKSAAGVQNMGKALAVGDKGAEAALGSVQASRINDPNPGRPNTPPPANPNNRQTASTASAGTTPADKSNDIALQQAGLGAVDSQTTSGLAAIDKALGNLIGQYDTEAKANEGNYTTQSQTNQNNLQSNKQTALINGAQGRRSLFGSLSSIGALNGDGITLANDAVRKGVNTDLSGAANNYATNQTTLDTGINTFRQEDKQRRDNANNAAEDARTNVRADAAKSKQQFLTNLANDFAAEGNSGQAKVYSDQAAALYPEVAKNNVPSSNLAYSSAAFTPATLSSYLAGANNMTVSTKPSTGNSNGLPGLVAATDPRKKLATV